MSRIFGNANPESGLSTSKLLDMTIASWDVYHINVLDYQGTEAYVKTRWQSLLKEHLINTERGDGNDIAGIISGIILSSYREQTSEGLSKAEKDTQETQEKTEHLL